MLRTDADRGGRQRHGAGRARPGPTVAGKTGTAQKYDPATRTYAAGKYVSSFVGFPRRPRPRWSAWCWWTSRAPDYYGGEVAAPVFRDIMDDVRRLRDGPLGTGATVRWRRRRRARRGGGARRAPAAGAGARAAGRPSGCACSSRGAGRACWPSRRRPAAGRARRPGDRLARRAGRLRRDRAARRARPDAARGPAPALAAAVPARIAGRGVVVRQPPAAGSPSLPGSECRLWCEPGAPPAALPVTAPGRPARRPAGGHVTLRALLEAMDAPLFAGDEAAEVTGLAYDSRRVRAGDWFFALPGLRQDGRAFVRRRRRRAPGRRWWTTTRRPARARWYASRPRRALAEAAVLFHGQPARALKVVGITGTNGKTTPPSWSSRSRAAGWRPGVLGTVGARLDGRARPLGYTTPEATELHALLREMVDGGVEAVALEVSSHALVQRRGYGLDFDVAVFTNLSHDHLDFHGTLEAYLDAKLMLFDGRNARAPGEARDRGGERRRPGGGAGGGGGPPRGHAGPALRRRGRRGRAPRARRDHARSGLELELAAGGHPVEVRLPLLGRYNA